MPRRTKEGERNMKKGQMWSVDVIIGIVIFVSIITVFYTTLSDTGSDPRPSLKANADTVETKFTENPNYRVITQDGVLNVTRLEELAQMNYTQLKQDLGIESDFCIYIEDEEGRLMPLGNKTSIGNSRLNISQGLPCGSDAP